MFLPLAFALQAAATAAPAPAPAATRVAAIPAQSCLANAPALSADPLTAFPNAVDGATVKDLKAVAKLRAKGDAKLIVVRGGDFSKDSLGKTQLTNTCFIGSIMAGADLREARTSGLGFIRADLSGARLAGADLPFVLLREANLSGADATGATLTRGRLDGGWAGSLENLKLDRAKLTGFQVVCGTQEADGCPFNRAGLSVRGADFTGANIASFTFWNSALDGAIVDGTHVGLHQIGSTGNLVVRGPLIVHSPRRRVTLAPDDYKLVREGVKLLAPARGEAAAATDCTSVADRRARAVCAGGPELVELERRALAAPRAPGALAAFNTRQNFCVDLSDDLIAPCLSNLYRAEAQAAAASAAVVTTGSGGALRQSALWAALPVSFTDTFKRTPIYTRVLPVFLDAAPTQIYAILAPDGTLALRGGSQGGCRVNGDGLVFDTRTGWYGKPGEATPARTVRYRGRRVRVPGGQAAIAPMVRFGPGGVEFAPGATGTLLTCRADAELNPVAAVDAPAPLVELLATTTS